MSGLSTLYLPVGAIIGLASAAPVGPVNLLVIQRALTGGATGALLLGVAGAFGDALFAAAAAFGVPAIMRLLADHAQALRLGGGLIMCAFAVVIWRSTPRLRDDANERSTLRMAAATLTLTLTNPATILFFVGAFGVVGFSGIGHATPAQRINAALVVAGTFAGSMLWWLIVTSIARRLRGRITDATLRRLNRGTAGLLVVFAVAAVLTGVFAR